MLWNTLNQTVELGWDFYLPVILFVALCGLAALSLACGLILDTTVKGHRRDWELRVIEAYGERDGGDSR